MILIQISKYIKPADITLVDFVDCKSGGVHFNGLQSDEFHRSGKCLCAHLGRGSNMKGKAIRKGYKHPVEQKTIWVDIAKNLIAGD